jgi:hypothetical protein
MPEQSGDRVRAEALRRALRSLCRDEAWRDRVYAHSLRANTGGRKRLGWGAFDWTTSQVSGVFGFVSNVSAFTSGPRFQKAAPAES